MYGLSAFLERCLDELGVGRRKLVVHDWGSLALIGAQRRPELVEKLVVINAVPLLPGYRWHWVAQIWRRRGLGELANATTTRSSMALLMRQASGDRKPIPKEFVDATWRHWDKGTQAATLALYRHADPDRLAAAGKDLNGLTCPSLVLWGNRDPYLPTRFAKAYAAVLPSSTLQVVPAAGHWPWLDDARVIDDILNFLV
jgi:pimeloyl-ACP methyl ester carboxylesterase